MSYPKDLDEYDDDHLQAELKRRHLDRSEAICDYCERAMDVCDALKCAHPRRAPSSVENGPDVGGYRFGAYVVAKRRGGKSWRIEHRPCLCHSTSGGLAKPDLGCPRHGKRSGR